MKRIPFYYEEITPSGDSQTSKESLMSSSYGIIYNDVQKNITASLCAIIVYESKKQDTQQINVVLRKGDSGRLDGDMLPLAFLAHPTYGRIEYIELIMMFTGCYPLKWRIYVS